MHTKGNRKEPYLFQNQNFRQMNHTYLHYLALPVSTWNYFLDNHYPTKENNIETVPTEKIIIHHPVRSD